MNRSPQGASPSPIWSVASRLLWLALLAWIVAGWAATAGHWSPGYPVDAAATILLALPLALAAMASSWHAQRQALIHAQSAHKQWLSVLLVKRDQAERAAETLEALCESLDHLAHRSRAPTADEAPLSAPIELGDARPDLDLIAPLAEQGQTLRPLLQAVRARLINLHVRLGRGDPIEGLSFEVQPLTEDFQQVEHQFNAMFERVGQMQQQLEDAARNKHRPDPYADLRPWIESAQDDLAQTRLLLAETLGRPIAQAPNGLDNALGLTKDHV